MSNASETLTGLPVTRRTAVRRPLISEPGDERRRKRAQQNQLQYRRRKAAGLCPSGLCLAKTEPGRAHCRKHLQAMAERADKKRKERRAQNLCLYCGERPQFWGRHCIICREVYAEDPLPRGAKQALRRYREEETRGQENEIKKNVRTAALELLRTKRVVGKFAQALRLYAGVDDGRWRSYMEISQLMKISRERVRQLLLPSKRILSVELSGNVTWKKERYGAAERSSKPLAYISDHHPDFLRSESISNPGGELLSVVLMGQSVDRCDEQICEEASSQTKGTWEISLARAILQKPRPLSGRELRFLRRAAGLTPGMLARKLGVAVMTVRVWEESKALRRPNDVAARMVISSIILGLEDPLPISLLIGSLRDRSLNPQDLSS